jgi:predicted FMN-binding regulatory protein PaiB
MEFDEKTCSLLVGNKYDPDFDMTLNIKGNFKLLSSIVGIEISVDEVFAKFKLAQSKSAEERINVIKVLTESTNSVDQAVAKAMQETLKSLSDI